MNAETQTPESGVKIAQNAETQTTEFENIFKQAVLQPFTEENFADHDDRVRFYTGLPGFDVLKATFSFISPFVTGRSKNLSLFQEFIMVVMKLRLNVPLQDLAYRFGVSLSSLKNLLHLVNCDEYQAFPYHQMAWTRWALAHDASLFSVLIWKKNHHYYWLF